MHMVLNLSPPAISNGERAWGNCISDALRTIWGQKSLGYLKKKLKIGDYLFCPLNKISSRMIWNSGTLIVMKFMDFLKTPALSYFRRFLSIFLAHFLHWLFSKHLKKRPKKINNDKREKLWAYGHTGTKKYQCTTDSTVIVCDAIFCKLAKHIICDF